MGMLGRGIYTPLVTPFSDDEIDFQSLLYNVDKLNNSSIQGYLILGSSSESILLNREERLQVIERVIGQGRDAGKMILVGVMEESTKSAISFVAEADKFDPDVYLILPPTYYKPSINEDIFLNFYNDLSKTTKVPLFYYNVPMFSGLSIESKSLIKIIEKDYIKGWKDSSTELERFIDIQKQSNFAFQSFTGNAGLLLDSLKNGSEGGILAISNALPDLCTDIYSAFSSGNFEEADILQSRLKNFADNVTTPFGIAGLKYAMSLLGFNGGSVRKPYSDLNNEDGEQLRQFLDSY
ncbi:MAG: dihydrodipicolinate synthase family protein [Candidatus Marinimicrobia bacterium]|nr:dihydrodipicolinate synthase family protein [Candidatus Neomarinimicrobiota bacterium]